MKERTSIPNLGGAARATVAAGVAAALMVLTACASGGGFRVESGPDDGQLADEVPAGTELTTELEDRLSVFESEKGDEFHLTVDEPVTRGGRTAVPAGGLVHGRVTAVHASTGDDDPNILKLEFYRIDIRGQSYPLEAEATEVNPERTTEGALEKIAGGAFAGAVLGAIIDDDELRGAAIGGAIGAAAGTAVALGTKREQGVLARGSRVRLRLNAPVRLQ